MLGRWLGVAALAVGAQAATFPNITAEQIAFVVASTGLLPESIAQAAGSLVYGILQTTEAQLEAATAGCTSEKCQNPELYYSYGNSPPVYPSPNMTGSGNWSTAYAKARALVAQMTDEEKNTVVTPLPAANFSGCSGFSGGVSRLGYSGLCLNDNGNNVHLPGANITGFTSGISVAAGWNRNLTYRRAVALGKEFKAMGINVALGPVVGPLGKTALGGRNWEGLSNDPYLAGQLVAPSVAGMQESVIACAKHLIGNEQETNRQPFMLGLLAFLGLNANNSVSSNIDDRTLHELYLYPFADAVRAGVGSVMVSYNRLNNSYSAQNSKLMNGLLKTELGFQGFVVSDWLAQHTGVASANAGLDLVMPKDYYWGNGILAQAKANGSLESDRLDDMATRILASWYRYAELENPGVTPNINNSARTSESHAAALQSAIEGHVLVKNENNALPFGQLTALNIFGYDAISGDNTSASSSTLYPNGLSNTQQYTDGTSVSLVTFLTLLAQVAAPGTSIPEIALNGTVLAGGGSGSVVPPLIDSPYDELAARSVAGGFQLYTDFISQNPSVQDSTAPCLVFINAQATETADRLSLNDAYSDTLVENVAAQCNNTMVVLHNMGIRLLPSSWADNDNVTAIIYAHAPGENSGNALAAILFGETSPSGRMPYTVAYNESDYGVLLNPTFPTAEHPQFSQDDFSEGVFIDYRHFIKQNITARYPFGFGLTYSSFNYSNLQTQFSQSPSVGPPDAGNTPSEGGLDSLFDNLGSVTMTVSNVGNVQAAEVAQLYIGIPASGVAKALRGFEKVELAPGSSAQVTFPLRRRDLSMWNVVSQQWELQSGSYSLMAGKSVEDIQLMSSVTLL